MITDGIFAQDANSGTSNNNSCTNAAKDKHQFSNYGIAVPGGTVTGIEVSLNALADSTSNSPKICVQLSWDGGTTWTAPQSTPRLSTTSTTYILGSSTDTWGRTWAPAELADASFRLRVIDVANSTSRTFSLDGIAVQVSYR